MYNSDQDTLTLVIFQLTMDERINGSLIDVRVENGKAILKGTVTNSNAKKAAEEDTFVVLGAGNVDNQLVVRNYSSH